MIHDIKLNEIVYHRNVYNHREPLKVVGIRENELELEGDYSGGTHNVVQKDWLPINGVSRIFNYSYKKECRAKAITIEEMMNGIPMDSDTKRIINDLKDMVLVLTNDITYNAEY